MKIAIVGSGISGLSAAWMLARKHEVTLYEAADRLGGHANTVDIELDGCKTPVDTGFIVYNEHNYPNLTRLFDALGVLTDASDMSFAVSLGAGRYEYFGSLPGFFAQPANLFRPGHWRMLRDLVRFYREAPTLLSQSPHREPSLGEVLAKGGYSEAFASNHLLPMVSAIWSSSLDRVLDFPARTFVSFFVNHGLFSLGERPQWRTVDGGSRAYVRRLAEPFRHRVRLAAPVMSLRRTPAGIVLRDGGGHEDCFDQIVLATHGDQALAILGAAATQEERRILGAFRYQTNRAILHRDQRLMPRRRRVWASWNYLAETGAGATRAVAVSYWMNRLQKLDSDQQVFVTLNPIREPAAELTHAAFQYDHPQFDEAALAAQRELPQIQGLDRVWFCGSYLGYGFHEDGAQAGLAVAAALGAPAPWAASIVPMSPAAEAATPAVPAMAAE